MFTHSLILSALAASTLAAHAGKRWSGYGHGHGVSKVARASAPSEGSCAPYWYETIDHAGVAAFNPDPAGYNVFRNVKTDFGAVGDGVADDTAAIQAAISAGDRCGPGECQSSTTSPAVVYFPAGTYKISAPIVDYYYTQIVGNPNCPPVITTGSNFTGVAVIDADPYGSSGNLEFGATNTFYRQIRNFVIDMTNIPATSGTWGIHWPTAQATSLQNIEFKMSEAANTQHIGVFIESGSAGFLNDLTFHGGLNGLQVGNQQYTMRGLSFYNSVVAINQLWDWGWTYAGLTIENCSVGLNMSAGGQGAQTVASVTLFDSSFKDTGIAVQTAHDASNSSAAGSLIMENISLNNVPVAVAGANGTQLAGTSGSSTINAYGQGHSYTPEGPNVFTGAITGNTRPAALTSNGTAFYTRSKPQYETLPVSSFLSARAEGATGDGKTDDTAALNAAITKAASAGQVLFVDHGDYLVTDTIYVPAGSKIVGESYSVILGSGAKFASMNSTLPVVQVGKSGETGTVEWSDMIVSGQGATQGAVFIEWNLAAPAGSPAGMWDVHARIGGFAGSDLQVSECPTTPNVVATAGNIDTKCIVGAMTMHVTPSAAGLYMENNWLWVADHDIEDANETQISVYNARGLYVESTAGPTWLWGTAVEHHTLYQYQFANTSNVFMGQIQTETPYYQPNPDAAIPFPSNPNINDPLFDPVSSAGPFANSSAPAANNNDAWGLRILSSSNVLGYGAGLYSFFNNYSTNCSAVGAGEACQNHNFEIENAGPGVSIYNLNTVGTTVPFVLDGKDVGYFQDNYNGFVDTVAIIRPS